MRKKDLETRTVSRSCSRTAARSVLLADGSNLDRTNDIKSRIGASIGQGQTTAVEMPKSQTKGTSKGQQSER